MPYVYDLPADLIGVAFPPAQAEILTYLFSSGPIQGLVTVVSSGTTVTVQAGVSAVLLNKVSPGDTTIQLGSIAQRTVSALQIVDVAGTAGTITLLPHAGETIMGLTSGTLISYAQGLGSAANITLWPNAALSLWYNAT